MGSRFDWGVWRARDLSLARRFMECLGWVPRDITRTIVCAWCWQEFEWSGTATNEPPRFCSNTHKTSAKVAGAKRLAQTKQDAANRDQRLAKVPIPAPTDSPRPPKPLPDPPAPATPPPAAKAVCECTNHMGTHKVQYKTNQQAAIGLVRRHLRHGYHRIYKCPTTDLWHITSKRETHDRRVA